MNCQEFLHLVPLYLSGELAVAQTGEFAAHRVRCQNCARHLNDSIAIDAELREAVLAEPVVTGAVERRVQREIAREAAARSGNFRKWGAAAGLVAAAVILFFALPRKATGLLAAAARDHRTEIVDRQPRRWKPGIQDAEQLATSRGIRSSLISALETRGYRFREARLCRLDGYVFLHLVYLDRTGEFSVFLRDDDGGMIVGSLREAVAGKAIYATDSASQHAAGFTDGRLRALIVTADPGALLRIAHEAALAL